MGFESFSLDRLLLARIRALGFEEPTPIQREAIPHALLGRDVLGLAQTGTGKTAAFALPILQRLLKGPEKRTRALVIGPTRELVEQIHEAFQSLGKGTGIRSATVYGGVGIRPQLRHFRSGVEVLVACPGRLLDHMRQGAVDLSRVEVLVLDEADQMFDMGFWPDIRSILQRLPAKRQTMLFSATMPDGVRDLAGKSLHRPRTVSIDHGVPLATVAHALYPVREDRKVEMLLALLRKIPTGSVLVFTRTKHRAKRLGARVEREGFSAASIQGNLSQNKRKAVMDGFRDGSHRVLVATDIAARGIDVSRVSHVINFDVPVTPEAYTHRIGRTGRAAKTGDAFTLVTQADSQQVRAIEKLMGKIIERKSLEGFDALPVPSESVPPRKPSRGMPRSGSWGRRRSFRTKRRH